LPTPLSLHDALPISEPVHHLERDRVTDVDRVRRERHDPRLAVLDPAEPLVEPPRAVVVLEHPEVAALAAVRPQPLEHLVVERPPDTAGPPLWQHVQPVEPLAAAAGHARSRAVLLG